MPVMNADEGGGCQMGHTFRSQLHTLAFRSHDHHVSDSMCLQLTLPVMHADESGGAGGCVSRSQL